MYKVFTLILATIAIQGAVAFPSPQADLIPCELFPDVVRRKPPLTNHNPVIPISAKGTGQAVSYPLDNPADLLLIYSRHTGL